MSLLRLLMSHMDKQLPRMDSEYSMGYHLTREAFWSIREAFYCYCRTE